VDGACCRAFVDVDALAGVPVTITWGECGHPLRGDPMAIDYDGCRVCFLINASSAAVRWHADEAAHGGARYIFAEFIRATREWGGREAEAHAVGSARDGMSNEACALFERNQRPRGTIEVVDEGRIRSTLADARYALAGENPNEFLFDEATVSADNHVGHTRREVDVMLGRIDYDPVTGEPPRERYMRGSIAIPLVNTKTGETVIMWERTAEALETRTD
jgi:hypothetical protein